MQVVLFRHAPAEDRDPSRWPDDRDRPLTAAGRRVARRSMAGILASGVRPSHILTSPAVRSAETARAAVELLDGEAPEFAEWDELGFDAEPQKALERLAREHPSGSPTLLIGHEPGLGQLAGLLLVGEPVSVLRLKRGGAALLEVPRRAGPGAGRLEWVLTRKQLGALAPRGAERGRTRPARRARPRRAA